MRGLGVAIESEGNEPDEPWRGNSREPQGGEERGGFSPAGGALSERRDGEARGLRRLGSARRRRRRRPESGGSENSGHSERKREIRGKGRMHDALIIEKYGGERRSVGFCVWFNQTVVVE